MAPPKIFFCGDNHGHFRHIIAAVERDKPDAIVLLGDIEASRPLELELAPILGKTVIRYIHGNHDTDTDFNVRNVFESKLAGCNLDGRVENIAGVRIAGLGGIFRSKSWMPPAAPRHRSYDEWLAAMRRSRKGIGPTPLEVVLETQARTQRSTIFWDTYERLWDQRADVLVTHEAPSVHPHGFAAIDELARAMGVQATFHGHHHDALNYRGQWERIGFKAYGVGFCGITDLYGGIVRPGDFGRTRREQLMDEPTPPSSAATNASASQDGVSIIEAEVIAIVLPYHQAVARSKDHRHYAMTRHTAGVVLEEIHEGQRLELTVTRAGAVLRATPLNGIGTAAC